MHQLWWSTDPKWCINRTATGAGSPRASTNGCPLSSTATSSLCRSGHTKAGSPHDTKNRGMPHCRPPTPTLATPSSTSWVGGFARWLVPWTGLSKYTPFSCCVPRWHQKRRPSASKIDNTSTSDIHNASVCDVDNTSLHDVENAGVYDIDNARRRIPAYTTPTNPSLYDVNSVH